MASSIWYCWKFPMLCMVSWKVSTSARVTVRWLHLSGRNCLTDYSHRWKNQYFEGLVQYCSNSIANALELLQSCAKPSIWAYIISEQPVAGPLSRENRYSIEPSMHPLHASTSEVANMLFKESSTHIGPIISLLCSKSFVPDVISVKLYKLLALKCQYMALLESTNTVINLPVGRALCSVL